jgi:hypothetical protein
VELYGSKVSSRGGQVGGTPPRQHETFQPANVDSMSGNVLVERMVCYGVQNSGGRGYAARRDDSAEALPGTHALWPVRARCGRVLSQLGGERLRNALFRLTGIDSLTCGLYRPDIALDFSPASCRQCPRPVTFQTECLNVMASRLDNAY